MRFLAALQRRWGLTGWSTVAVLAAFSLAGTTTVLLKQPVTGLVVAPEAPSWIQWSAYLVVMVPLYHVLLLAWGSVLGQFGFFWKKMAGAWKLASRVRRSI